MQLAGDGWILPYLAPLQACHSCYCQAAAIVGHLVLIMVLTVPVLLCPRAPLPLWLQAARADALARQLKRVEGARSSSSSSLNRLKRENDALKTLLLELAADRQAAQARLAELQERMADLASVSVTGSMLGEVRC